MGIAYGTTTLHQATKGIVQDGLVLNLDAGVRDSYDSGTTWRDLKGSNNGTLTNGPTFNKANGGGLVFDGANAYINCGQNFNITSNNSFSLSVWVSPSSTGSWQGILQRGRNTGQWYGIWQNGSKFVFGASPHNLFSSSNLSAGLIYNVTVTQNTSGKTLYINGVLDASTSSYYNGSDPSAPLTVGYAYWGSEYFNGEIFVALLYNRTLTATEVAQNFNATRHRFGI